MLKQVSYSRQGVLLRCAIAPAVEPLPHFDNSCSIGCAAPASALPANESPPWRSRQDDILRPQTRRRSRSRSRRRPGETLKHFRLLQPCGNQLPPAREPRYRKRSANQSPISKKTALPAVNHKSAMPIAAAATRILTANPGGRFRVLSLLRNPLPFEQVFCPLNCKLGSGAIWRVYSV